MFEALIEAEQSEEYAKRLEHICEQFVQGVNLLDHDDKLYMLDKVEEARWVTGATYNRGVHILLDMVQYAVEQSYRSPNG
ncbi:hypothetical protein vB_PsyM_KIL3b_0015 [Pseudomonas phage vB_PsyM_KIL3b]|uniref:Uncharacterized protein n=4 Tax=Pseudomonas phage vB_PsyM_KIL1 TaxID=1777065 RepID=A0A142IDX1_9CAUD|nr:hypothetical protein BH774_gp015 [Pseudomonas phage vB_PsyM_KIL1]AMR57267.1 hypothetical protein vB_PsyM_KIL1_0015 [Pseudomonas phage vB_PsyM_KIL1]AMR57426.1 hypothetical protein vB_PsyM_KIL2_0015 [Pseudomonas phage vB_PsyM_KIL2]AMR57587.1 hypothetical protein vB_PsyM_KIL3_0015 [Pseudomonas phage vB_PsyM_KIL3]AMR58085.1 hypothetical protein vB_PsyM_KIL3b_0015 [Pseudomonas phage vB_PsyM_KIL3b]